MSKQPHVEIYLRHFKLHDSDDWQCEACQKMDKLQNFDIHHIQSRSSMGGVKKANRIENLQCLCRPCHIRMGDYPDWKAWLYKVHIKELQKSSKPFDRDWIEEQITRYEKNV